MPRRWPTCCNGKGKSVWFFERAYWAKFFNILKRSRSVSVSRRSKIFELSISNLGAPLVGYPAPEFFKLFQVLCKCGIRLHSCSSLLCVGVQTRHSIADLAGHAVHETPELCGPGTRVGDSKLPEPFLMSAAVEGWGAAINFGNTFSPRQAYQSCS